MSKVERLLERHSKMMADKEPFNWLYQQVADFVLPNKSNFNRLYGQADKRRRMIFDVTAEHAADIFASSIIGLVANPANRWFSIEMMDERLNRNTAVTAWCEQAGQSLLNFLNNPRVMFYGHLKSALLDTAAFGMPALYLNEVKTPDLFSLTSLPLSDITVDESADAQIDTVFYCKKMDARQLMQRAESDGWKLHKNVIKAAKDNPKQTYDILQAIYPRADYKKDSMMGKDMPIASCIIDKSNKHEMLETGFYEMPVAVARWDRATGEIYARSPAMIALADIMTLNVAMRYMLSASERSLNPTVWLPNDNSPRKVGFQSGSVNFYDATKGRPEFFSGTGDLRTTYELIQGLRNSIRSVFYVDQLQLNADADMTATEVMQRTDEKARLLAPSLGRIQSELLAPLLERALNIMVRRGAAPAPPKEIRGQQFRVLFSTPVTRAQRSGDAQNIQLFMAELAQVLQLEQLAMQSASSDQVQFAKVVQELMDIRGVSGVFREDEKVIKDKSKARAAQQQMQEVLATSGAVAEVAKTASEADKNSAPV